MPSKLHKELSLGAIIVVAVGVLLRQLVSIEILEPRRQFQAASTCQSNLKQIGLAMIMYAQDYNETLPRAAAPSGKENWIEALLPYLHERIVFHCLSDESGGDSYVLNDAYSLPNDGLSAPAGQPLIRIHNPPQTLLVADGAGDFRLRWELKDGVQTKIVNDQLRVGSVIGRHYGMPNILYCDGHVASYGTAQVFSPSKTKAGKPYFPGLAIESN